MHTIAGRRDNPRRGEPTRAISSAMKRRTFIRLTGLGLTLAAPPYAAEAQQAKVARIGWLDAGMTPTAAAPSGALRDFEERLTQLGRVPGRSVVIEQRFADTYWDRLPGLAQDLVRQRVEVIVTIGTATVFHAKKATTTIPIVMAGAGEPLELGLVSSLSHPAATSPGSRTIRARSSRARALNCSRPRPRRSRASRSCGIPSPSMKILRSRDSERRRDRSASRC